MFLNDQYSSDFRDSINSSDIFSEDEDLENKYILMSAIMDRLDSAITYLNEHSSVPETENELLFFITHACIVYDAMKELAKHLDFIYPFDNFEEHSYKFFKETCKKEPLNISDNECPTDDRFFEYIRSMILAHPFNTDRPKFFEKGEIQYSPFIIANSRMMSVLGSEDGVGFRIYSNKSDGLKDLIFSFEILKSFIASRFELLRDATMKIEEIIASYHAEWRKQIVYINGNKPTNTLVEIRRIMSERFLETYEIDMLIFYIEFKITKDSLNYEIVTRYKKEIISIIPNLVHSMNNIEHDNLYEILGDFYRSRPRNLHKGSTYQLEKTFGYLKRPMIGTSNYEFGIDQCKQFYTLFASKWVTIDFDTMDCEEIKMLITISLYFEQLEQSK